MRELRSAVVSTCLVPVNAAGDVCGQKFVKGQEELAARHGVSCTRRHADAIREVAAQRHPEIMLPWDPELAQWMKDNADGIMRGRLRA